jgi:hypothetical protein
MLKTPPKQHGKFAISKLSKSEVAPHATSESEISDESISKRNGKAKDEL